MSGGRKHWGYTNTAAWTYKPTVGEFNVYKSTYSKVFCSYKCMREWEKNGMKLKKSKYCVNCKGGLPPEAQHDDYPYRMNLMLFCSKSCMEEKKIKMAEKQSATIAMKKQKKAEEQNMEEQTREIVQEAVQESNRVVECELKWSPKDRVIQELESEIEDLKQRLDLKQKIIDTYSEEIKLKCEMIEELKKQVEMGNSSSMSMLEESEEENQSLKEILKKVVNML